MLSSELSRTILRTICNRYTAESSIATDTTIKVLQIFGKYLNTYVCKISDSSSDTHQFLLDEALNYAKLLKTFVDNKFEASDMMETFIYNIGVNSCNLGIYAYKLDNFLMAAELFSIGVEYLHHCTKLSHKSNALQIIRKKAGLLKDSLRLANCLKEAGLKTVHLVLQGILPHSEIIPTWIKCKRDDIKSGQKKLKNITIRDIFEETLCLKEIPPSEEFSIEDLLFQEIVGLQQLGLDTVEEEIICAKALILSSSVFHQIEGYINLAQVLWSHPGHPQAIVSKSAVDTISSALNIINSCGLENKQTLQMLARIHFWMYLCKLQEIQQRAEVEINSMEEETQSLTVHSTDLGEEIQSNDACNVRPSTTVTTFSVQEKTLEHLYESLKLWEEVIKWPSTKSTVNSCNILLSMLHIFKFCGLFTHALKAIVILLSFSQKCDLEKFWIQGMVELLHFAPELVSMEVIERLISIIEQQDQKLDQSTNYLKYEALASLAYYYYKIGQFSRGAEFLQKCLTDPLMEKRSIAACEVQVEVLFIASLYSLLPKDTLPYNLRITEPCLALALLAARKAIGLVKTAIEYFSGVFCYNFKVAWVHHKTNLWFGRLCQITAQPRSARAFLSQVLTLAERFASPLRTAESLSLLAEIDLQCDQLEDCRVKIDSLDSLFQIHNSSYSEEKTNVSTSYLPHKPCSRDIPQKKKNWSEMLPIHEDAIDENMRETEISPDYKLKLPIINFYSNIVIGEEDRISQLAHPNLLPSSPSFLYREENYVVNKINCPLDVIECSICISPEIHCIAIRLASMMAMIHCQQGNSRGAMNCLMQAEKQLDDFNNLSQKITSLMSSILEKVDHSELVFSCNDSNQTVMFLQSKMTLANLHYSLLCQEILCLEQDFGKAHSKNLNSLKFISELSCSVLASHLSTVVQVVLLGYSIEGSIKAKTLRDKECSSGISDCSPDLNVTECKEDISEANFKTPIRPRPFSNAHSGRPTSATTAKRRRNISTEMLASTLHKPSKDAMSFFILPDDDEAVPETKYSGTQTYAKKSFTKAKSNLKLPCSDINKALTSNVLIKQKRQVVKKSIQLHIDNLETSFDSLSINESSPFHDILQLPKKEELKIKYDQFAKTYAGSADIRKTTKKLSNEKQLSQNIVDRPTKIESEKIVNYANVSPILPKVNKETNVDTDGCENIPPNSRSKKVVSRIADNLSNIPNISVKKSNTRDVAERNLPNTRSRSTRAKPCRK